MTTVGATRRRWLLPSAMVIGLVVVAGPMTAFGTRRVSSVDVSLASGVRRSEAATDGP